VFVLQHCNSLCCPLTWASLFYSTMSVPPRTCMLYCSLCCSWICVFYRPPVLPLGMVRNGIPRVFCSAEKNSRNSVGINHLFRLFRLPRNNYFVGNCQPYIKPSRRNHSVEKFNVANLPWSVYILEKEKKRGISETKGPKQQRPTHQTTHKCHLFDAAKSTQGPTARNIT
jgi:hypothetical protein